MESTNKIYSFNLTLVALNNRLGGLSVVRANAESCIRMVKKYLLQTSVDLRVHLSDPK